MILPDVKAAVTECLAQARKSKLPYIAVSSYIQKLERKPGWSQADVRSVRDAVMRALNEKPPEKPQKR